MMGQQCGGQDRLFYSFNLETHVPSNHLLRGIDRFLDLSDLRRHLSPCDNSFASKGIKRRKPTHKRHSPASAMGMPDLLNNVSDQSNRSGVAATWMATRIQLN